MGFDVCDCVVIKFAPMSQCGTPELLTSSE